MKVKNWFIRHSVTGQCWNGEVIRGWTQPDNKQLFDSQAMAISLPLYGEWVNADSGIPLHVPAMATVESSRQRRTKDRVKHRAIARRLKLAEVGVGG